MDKIKISVELELTQGELFDWIEDFFSQRRVKANQAIVISHDITEDLSDYLFEKIKDKFNKK